MNQANPTTSILPSQGSNKGNTASELKATLNKTAQYISSVQLASGAIPWFVKGKLDPWDHTEAAMGLSICGFVPQATKAYLWLKQSQLADGSWHGSYAYENHYRGMTSETDLKETNFIAYVATGVWHHFLITKDQQFLENMFACVRSAIDYVLQFQSNHGEIAWAVDADGQAKNDALLTACSSIYRSLECACLISEQVNEDCPTWKKAAQHLGEAILHKPERFDRTWESKARFSMDWYYPILAGLTSQEQGKKQLSSRWNEFVVEKLGCRCVNDEPWVTMAETCELAIALVANKQTEKALSLFQTLEQWRDNDGGYWTGYVFKDDTIWPEEKTTWTAGAVILAADAIFELSPGAKIFTSNSELCML